MKYDVGIIGAGLAGSQAALTLADAGYKVALYEMRPAQQTAVHKTANCAELVCSNSLKSMKASSAAGMLKDELDILGSHLYQIALRNQVAAGGALAVDREAFSSEVTSKITEHYNIDLINREIKSLEDIKDDVSAAIISSGPLTSDSFAKSLMESLGEEELYFYDAAAPIVMADSLDMSKLFSQSRYEDGEGDYLNAPFTKEEYERFANELLAADRVILKDFESKELFQACQPIEEIARRGFDAPRFGTMKPIGLTDPRTGKRPWAALQLRKEDSDGSSYNLVGFQTNLTFPEQKRVFRMIPGLENAEFARYGVMHRNTFINAPRLIDEFGRLKSNDTNIPIYIAGQLSGTEGYCEAIRSGLSCALALIAEFKGTERVQIPKTTAFGSLMYYASSEEIKDYQPMHVNFGIFPKLEERVRNKKLRYEKYASRGHDDLMEYKAKLVSAGVIKDA